MVKKKKQQWELINFLHKKKKIHETEQNSEMREEVLEMSSFCELPSQSWRAPIYCWAVKEKRSENRQKLNHLASQSL